MVEIFELAKKVEALEARVIQLEGEVKILKEKTTPDEINRVVEQKMRQNSISLGIARRNL